jgi:hypothetical protein
MHRAIIKQYAPVLFPLLVLGLSACSEDYAVQRDTPDRLHSRYPNPYYREYGPWDMPQGNVQPGPPTRYGCPQGSTACYPD